MASSSKNTEVTTFAETARIGLLTKIFSQLGFAFDNFPDFRTIHYQSVTELVRHDGYNELVDASTLYDTIMEICAKADPVVKQNTTLDQKRSAAMAKAANEYLKGIPYKYQVLLRIPYSGSASISPTINKRVGFLTADESVVEQYAKANGVVQKKPEAGVGGLQTLLGTLLGPQIPLPADGHAYLEVRVTGNAQGRNLTVFEADPMYLYKVFFALSYATGNLEKRKTSASDIYGTLNQFGLSIYTDDHKFAAELVRPMDEAKLITAYELKDDQKSLDNLTELFRCLVTEQAEASVEKLRNQIINSLFWYFETLKTENSNLRTVFFTSVLDSFFSTSQTKQDKAAVIASETTKSIQAEEKMRDEIVALYDDRNKIIHSEIQLFDYHAAGKKRVEMSSARVEVSATQAYNHFLTSRINRYIESLPN